MILQAKDLRIGNELMNGQVISLSNDDIVVYDGYQNWKQSEMVDGFEPIYLTEQWFLTLGFTRVGDFYIMSRLDIDYCFNYRDFKGDYTLRVEYTDSGDPNDDGKKYPVTFGIKYVHQLQNLMYWVSNGEIEQIELNK